MKNLLQRPTARLSRRVVFWIFTCVIVIEAIILIPSLDRREKELLHHIKALSEAKIEVMMALTAPTTPDQDLLKRISRLQRSEYIVGGALYDHDGTLIGTFGEPPAAGRGDEQSSGANLQPRRQDERYDVGWGLEHAEARIELVLRHDITAVKNELFAFFLRIAGLVFIISVFVTTGAWIALKPLVIRPILKLRSDLIIAGDAIRQNRASPDFNSASIRRQDELGEVITAFKQMYRKICETIDERKRAEDALQESLAKVEAYSRELNNELVKGRSIQNHFLPERRSTRPGMEMAAFFKPARQVAGDFYDVFELPSNHTGIVIADVCDKGVGAALFMALFRSLIRIFSAQSAISPHPSQGRIGDSERQPASPEHALRAISLTNDYIAQNHGDLSMFATIFFGVLDLKSGRLTYISGGHEPVFIIPRNGEPPRQLDATGPAVGMMADMAFASSQTTLKEGDILVGFTDGVSEALSAAGQFYSKKRLLDQLQPHFPSAKALVEQISRDVLRHTGDAEQFDDITLLAIKWAPAVPPVLEDGF